MINLSQGYEGNQFLYRKTIFVILLQQEHLNAFPTKNDKGFQTVILFCYFRIT